MFNLKPKKNLKPLNEEIERVLKHMSSLDLESEEYNHALRHLERLTAVKTETRPKRVSGDTMLTVVGNLLGVFTIVSYEHVHVMTSKALGQVIKPK